LHADQGETRGKLAPELGRRHRLAFHQALDLLQDLRDRRRGRAQIAEQIGVAGDALLGIEIDEQERCRGDGRAAGAERIGHRHLDADAAHGADGELR